LGKRLWVPHSDLWSQQVRLLGWGSNQNHLLYRVRTLVVGIMWIPGPMIRLKASNPITLLLSVLLATTLGRVCVCFGLSYYIHLAISWGWFFIYLFIYLLLSPHISPICLLSDFFFTSRSVFFIIKKQFRLVLGWEPGILFPQLIEN
jgi:hypothetical protein